MPHMNAGYKIIWDIHPNHKQQEIRMQRPTNPKSMIQSVILLCIMIFGRISYSQTATLHGDPAISDAHESFMDRGERHYHH